MQPSVHLSVRASVPLVVAAVATALLPAAHPAAAAEAVGGHGAAAPGRGGHGADRVAHGAPAAAAIAARAGDPASDGFTIRDRRITESSGLAASRTHKHIYWTHNDSDYGPYIYAVDGRTGKTVATVTLRGVEARDVEAISVSPDGEVYVGDIGDNFDGRWDEVWIYRFSEPEKLRSTTVDVEQYTVRYDDGPRDAESLMVHPKTGRAYIASKSRENAGLYEGPKQLSSSRPNTFKRVRDIDTWATDGAFSPEGTRLLLRGYFSADMYRWKQGDSGSPARFLSTVPVPMQEQGESVTFTLDGRTLLLGSEGENSAVEPVEPAGDQRPESVQRRDEADGAEGDEDDSKEETGDQGGGADGGDDEGGSDLPAAAVTFLVAVALWMGLRRLFRRRD